jgi:hypothetical protein
MPAGPQERQAYSLSPAAWVLPQTEQTREYWESSAGCELIASQSSICRLDIAQGCRDAENKLDRITGSLISGLGTMRILDEADSQNTVKTAAPSRRRNVAIRSPLDRALDHLPDSLLSPDA